VLELNARVLPQSTIAQPYDLKKYSVKIDQICLARIGADGPDSKQESREGKKLSRLSLTSLCESVYDKMIFKKQSLLEHTVLLLAAFLEGSFGCTEYIYYGGII
jgi:hypothetical protein